MSKKYQQYLFRRRRPVVPFPEDFWSEAQPVVTLLRTYLGLGQEQPFVLDNALSLLGELDTRPLHATHAGAALLGRSLLIMLPLIDTRHAQHKRALGGKAKPLEFDLAELEQTLPTFAQLPTRLDALCRWLLADLWTLLRLLRAARDLFQRKRQTWETLHRLIGVVLLRLLLLYQKIERLQRPWIAHRCLRWALREVWGTLFGTPVKLTEPAKSLLERKALTIGQERELWVRLKRESDAGAEVPEPFREIVERWLAGDVPPPYQKEPLPPDKVRFWL